MRRFISIILFLIFTFVPYSAFAILSMELTRGVAGAIPIAVVPFSSPSDLSSHDVSAVIANDLKMSGRFQVFGKSALSEFPNEVSHVSSDYFRRLGTDNVVIGNVQSIGGGQYEVSFQLLDMFRGNGAKSVVINKKFIVENNGLRAVGHRISDLIYQHITGTRGIFSTKLAYVVVQQNPAHYTLEIADLDGFNPRPILSSPEPIMSPSWSPDGKNIAYVSFENRYAGIYVEHVATGSRHLISEFPGINGAPAWSPDGRKLAVVLSKTGSPNIYIFDIASHSLKQITNDFYINTEPAWSPDGKTLLFTSSRSGGAQIYQHNMMTGANTRVTYDGDYNARASFTRDGSRIAIIHRVSGIYSVGLMDLNTGTLKVLTGSRLDTTSPSVAPNGSMILYDTWENGRNVLGMVSSDGRVTLRLPAVNGDAQDPAWSPYLS